MTTPEITFVIPCHNGGEYLREAINSILSQKGDFTVSRIIVVDDRSTDNCTIEILEQISNEGVAKVIRSNHTSGPGGTRNAGVEMVNSEWVTFLDSDDLLLPGAIQCRVAALKQYPDAEFIGADFQLWWPESNKYDSPFFSSRPHPQQILQEAFSSRKPIKLNKPVAEFIQTSLTLNATSLIKTTLLQSVGGYEESIRYCEDHHLWIKLARIADFVFVPESIMLYRQHKNNMTKINIPPSKHYIEALKLLVAQKEFNPYKVEINNQLAEKYCATSQWQRVNGNYYSGLKYAIKGLVYSPLHQQTWRNILANIIMRR